VRAKLQNATSGFFEQDPRKNYLPLEWLPLRLSIDDSEDTSRQTVICLGNKAKG
jgi:hypothetical protein